MAKIFDSSHPIGEMKAISAITAPDGYLICNGSTIGNSGSGAATAQSLMFDLFSFLWTNYSNTNLVIQTSAGVGTTRGISAASDWAALKRMPLPSLNGRTLIGSGSYTDPISGSVTRALGASLGAEATTLSAANLPAHIHDISHTHAPSSVTITTDNSGVHPHAVTNAQHSHPFTAPNGAGLGVSAAFGADSSVQATFEDTLLPSIADYSIGLNAPITVNSGDGAHVHNGTGSAAGQTLSGSSGVGPGSAAATTIMQPSHVTNWIIRY